VDAKCHRAEKIAGDLRSRIAALRALGERSESGDAALVEVEEGLRDLREVSARLEKSISTLESVLGSAEAEFKARQLHREIGLLTRVAHAAPGRPADIEIRDATRHLERQIAVAIDGYIELEQSARRALDNIRLIEG
jgi:hypothetical protein